MSRLLLWPTIKRASCRVCQNATLIRFPASSQHSSKPLKTHEKSMPRARGTLQKMGRREQMEIPPPKAAMYFLAAATSTPGCLTSTPMSPTDFA
jgi:hypothetical protein